MDWWTHLQLQYNIRVNEAALEITLRSVKGDVKGTRKRILSLRTETLRSEIHCRAVSTGAAADGGRQDAQSQTAECAWPHMTTLSFSSKENRDRHRRDAGTFQLQANMR